MACETVNLEPNSRKVKSKVSLFKRRGYREISDLSFDYEIRREIKGYFIVSC